VDRFPESLRVLCSIANAAQSSALMFLLNSHCLIRALNIRSLLSGQYEDDRDEVMRNVRRPEAIMLVKNVDYISKEAFLHHVQALYNGFDSLPFSCIWALRLGSFGNGWDDRCMLRAA